ncbi:MAG: ABC transporter substrate-binding protein [Roseiflexaceae bacterium]
MLRVPSMPAARLAVFITLFALVLSGCGQSAGVTAPTAGPASAAPTSAAQAAGDLVFLSNQFKPVEEAERMRTVVLAQFPSKVEFIPEDPGPFNDRIRAEAQGGQRSVSLIGGLHGDLAPLAQEDLLEDLTPLMERLQARGFPSAFVELSKLGTGKHYYIPWMQATYVLAVNKQALAYLPQGADQNALTYAQLREWGANIQQATGERKLGFPGGPKGLMHRFFQGYLYPSYTGSAGVAGFKSAEAAAMWGEFQQLWAQANPQSTSYEFMQEPLLSGEVWVAWDHVARLINAPKERPDDFVLLPAPAGPQGRGFMPVVAGLAIPKGAPNRAAAEQLIEYLTQPQQQIATLRENAFFPVVDAALPADLPPGIRLQAEAVQLQSAATDARPSLLPIGLGAKGGEFNKVYLDTFQRIVLNREPVDAVLQQQGATLQQIMNETKAGCWPPDPPSEGPCLVR